MVWEPTVRVGVMYDAGPPEVPATARIVAPSLNVMVPVAVFGETLAVKVTFAPKDEGLTVEMSDRVVPA